MAASDSKSTKPTISGRATQCLESFQQCLDKAAYVHARELALIENQLANFSLWTAGFRIFGSGRESLDYRLRDVFDIQDAILGTLDALNYGVLKCTSIVEASAPVTSDATPLPDIDARLHLALHDIAKRIALLQKFSGAIRRAGIEAQDAKAIRKLQIRDSGGDDLEPFLKMEFGHHIRGQYPGARESIRQRLVNTMILRHKTILYRRLCSGKFLERDIGFPNPVEPTFYVPRSIANWAAQTIPGFLSSNTENFSTPFSTSVHKSVTLGGYENIRFPRAPCSSIMRRYDKLKKQREKEYSIKQETMHTDSETTKKYKDTLEKDWNEILEAAGEVDCPFCCLGLPAQDVVDENRWKLHVKNDLDPYVCLFEGCETPENLYGDSTAWLKHMSSHYLQWRCASKSHKEHEFWGTTKSEYIRHMKMVHSGKFTDAQLNILAARNSRPASSMFKPCPLCGSEKVDGGRADHVAGHLLLLALDSLPGYEEHEEWQEHLGYQQPNLPVSITGSESTMKHDSHNDFDLTVSSTEARSLFASDHKEIKSPRSAQFPLRQQQSRHAQVPKDGLQLQRDGDGGEFSQQPSFIPAFPVSEAKLDLPTSELFFRDVMQTHPLMASQMGAIFTLGHKIDGTYTDSVFDNETKIKHWEQSDIDASMNAGSGSQVANSSGAFEEPPREIESTIRSANLPMPSRTTLPDIGRTPADYFRTLDGSTDFPRTDISQSYPILSEPTPAEYYYPMARENLRVSQDPDQDFGDVLEFNQEWTNTSQQRNEASQILTNSFTWDGTVLTNQGLPLVDRQCTILDSIGPSSMRYEIQTMREPYPTDGHHQISTASVDSRGRWNDDLGKDSQQQRITQYDYISGHDEFNIHDFLHFDESLPSSDSADHENITSLAEFGQDLPSPAVKLTLDRMSEELDALYRRISLESNVSIYEPDMVDNFDENPATMNEDADDYMIQKQSPGSPDTHRSFMCPYAMRYPDLVHHNCFLRLNTISYLKQHLRQSHHDAANCPHRCQSRRSSAVSRRSRPNTALCFESGPCLQINKQRSDRSKTHKQQWERIYHILFPDADHIFDPCLETVIVKRLRSFFQFMENHGRECLKSIYSPKSTNPDPEVMYRTAFCTWLPRVFEWRFPPKGQQLLGDFLNQIKSVLDENYYKLEYCSGASRGDAIPLTSGSPMDQLDPSFTPMAQPDAVSSQQPPDPIVTTSNPLRRKSSTQPLMDISLFTPRQNSPPNIPSSATAVVPQADVDRGTPKRDEIQSRHELNAQENIFATHSEMHSSPIQLLREPAGNRAEIEISQIGTWKSQF